MNKTRFTPGPWTISQFDEILGPDDKDGDDVVLALMGCSSRLRSHRHTIAKNSSRDNARLIAAAPDLHDALEGLTRMYVQMINSGDCGKWDPEEDDEIIAARSALSKARGETP